MAPKPPPAKGGKLKPGEAPEEDEALDLQNPIRKIPVKYLWIGIGTISLICILILIVLLKKYISLLREDWSPYDEPMKNLRTTLSLGLRNRNVRYYQDPLKVSDLVVNLPEHIRKSEEDYAEEKKKYQSLYIKGVRSGGSWQLFGWNLYYISKEEERKTWHDAESFCMSRDSHLTSVLSEEEQTYISSRQNGSAWIGLTDENEEGIWEWSDGSRLAIQFWADGNPNGSRLEGDKDEDCIFMDTLVSGPNWKDASCQELRRWVCKESLQPEVPSS